MPRMIVLIASLHASGVSMVAQGRLRHHWKVPNSRQYPDPLFVRWVGLRLDDVVQANLFTVRGCASARCTVCAVSKYLSRKNDIDCRC